MSEASIEPGSVYGELELLAPLHDDGLLEVWEALGLSQVQVSQLAQNDLYEARALVQERRAAAGGAVFALYLPQQAPRTQYALRFHEDKPELYYPVPLLKACDNELVYGAGRYALSGLQGEAAFTASGVSITAYVPDFAAALTPSDIGVTKTVGLMAVMLTCNESDGHELGDDMKNATFMIPTEYTSYFDFRARVVETGFMDWIAGALVVLTLEVMLGERAVRFYAYGVPGEAMPEAGAFVAGRLWLQAHVR